METEIKMNLTKYRINNEVLETPTGNKSKLNWDERLKMYRLDTEHTNGKHTIAYFKTQKAAQNHIKNLWKLKAKRDEWKEKIGG